MLESKLEFGKNETNKRKKKQKQFSICEHERKKKRTTKDI